MDSINQQIKLKPINGFKAPPNSPSIFISQLETFISIYNKVIYDNNSKTDEILMLNDHINEMKRSNKTNIDRLQSQLTTLNKKYNQLLKAAENHINNINRDNVLYNTVDMEELI